MVGSITLRLLRYLMCYDTSRYHLHKLQFFLPHAVNWGRFWFCRCQSVFCLRNSRITERICTKFTRNTCLVRRSDVFESQGQRPRSRSRSPGTKTAFPALLEACIQFRFGKTSLASSYIYIIPFCASVVIN